MWPKRQNIWKQRTRWVSAGQRWWQQPFCSSTCEGETPPALLGLGWVKLHTLCVLCTLIMEADKARRRVLYWWRDTPQYLQILRWTGYSETLVCSVQLMLRAGWKGLSGDRKFLRGNTRCENGVQGLCLPATILSASSLTSFSLFVPDIVGPPVHPHMVWPSPIPSCTVSSCTSSDNEGSLNCSVLFLLEFWFCLYASLEANAQRSNLSISGLHSVPAEQH